MSAARIKTRKQKRLPIPIIAAAGFLRCCDDGAAGAPQPMRRGGAGRDAAHRPDRPRPGRAAQAERPGNEPGAPHAPLTGDGG